MPLQKQDIELPLGAAGIATGQEEKIIESPKFVDLENCEISKIGAMQMRKGYNAHGSTDLAGSTIVPIAIAQRARNRVVFEEARVLEFNSEISRWMGLSNTHNPISSESFMVYSAIAHDFDRFDVVGSDSNDLVCVTARNQGNDVYGIIYDPVKRVVVNADYIVEGGGGTITCKLGYLGNYIFAFYTIAGDGNLYFKRIEMTASGINTGWGSATTIANFANGSPLDLDYDGTYIYVAGQSSTANQCRIVAVKSDKSTQYNVSVGSGTGNYDLVSVTKHEAASNLLVMTANATNVATNIIDSTDGSQDQTDTIAITDSWNIVGYSIDASNFGLVIEGGADSAEDNYIKLYSIAISSAAETLNATFYGYQLAHKARGYLLNDTCRMGFARADVYEPQMHTVEIMADDPWLAIAARYSRRTAWGDDKYIQGHVSNTWEDSNSNVYFAFGLSVNVEQDDGTIDTSIGIALGAYTEDNNKRWNYAESQNCMYIAGSRPLMWDGSYLSSLGFSHAPSIATATADTSGSLTAEKTYQYIAVYEYYDSMGQRHQSPPSVATSITLGVGEDEVDLEIRWLADPWKTYINNASATMYSVPTLALYRTVGDGTTFYRLQTGNLEAVLGSSDYIDYNDTVADSAITDNETLYTTGGVLGNDCPPPCECICVHKNRLWVVDTESGDLCHTKEFLAGEGPAFNDEFRIPSGSQKNRPVWLESMDENLIVFWEDKIGVVYGDGPNDLGAGGSFTLPRIVAQIGVLVSERRSVVKTPVGIMFKSNDGIKLLDRSMQIQDIGRDVTDYNDQAIIGAHHIDKYHQVRFTAEESSGYACVLVFDYENKYWTRYKIDLDDSAAPIGAEVWYDISTSQPGHVLLKDAGTSRVYRENQTLWYDGVAANKVEYYFETNWIKLGGLQGYQRIYKAWLLGKYIGKHTLEIKMYYDYDEAEGTSDTLTLSDAETAAARSSAGINNRYQIKFGIPQQRCQAIKFKFTFATTSGQTANACADVTGLRLEYGVSPRGARKKNVYSTYS